MAFEEDVLKELKDINGNVNETKISTARIEGKLDTHEMRIQRNEDDIAKTEQGSKDSDRRLHERVEKVEGKLNGIAVKVAGAATAAGAAAGAAINAAANAIGRGG